MGAMPRPRAPLAFLGLLLVAGCGGDEPAPRPASPRVDARPRPPGVVLIVVDTLRADGVAIGGDAPGPMPALRAWAQGATTFADALAPAAWTPQAMPSILTGLSPPHHGCEGMAETNVPPLPGAVTTLAEHMKAFGYTTAAFTSGGFFAVAQGLYQGFESFAEELDTEGPESCVAKWMDTRVAGRPFFLVLHTYLPHDPYGPKDSKAMHSAGLPTVPASPTLERTYGDPGRSPTSRLDPDTMRECAYEWFCDGMARPANSRLFAQKWARDFVPAVRAWCDGGYLADPTGRAAVEDRLRRAYLGGLGIMDGFLARLFAALDAVKLPPDTITIVTSDHGESFGDHGYLLHERHLHDEIVRVPLFIRAPGRMPVGAVIRGTCGPVDVLPTIVELVGRPPVRGVDGRSLVSLANGKAGGHPIVATADRYEAVGGGHRAVREVRVRDATRVWSYVYDVATGERIAEVAFDLVKDPGMQTPLPLASVEWPDDETCALVASTRNEVRTRFGLAPLDPPCKGPR